MTFNGKLGLVQRVLPVYRAPFFDALASACTGGLDVFAGEPRPDESIVSAEELNTAGWTRADNLHLLRGPLYLCYQRGLMDWLTRLAARRAHRGGEPTLPRDLLRGEVDAPKGIAGHRLGTRSPPPSGWFAGFRRSARLRFLRQFDALISYSARGAEQYAALGYPATESSSRRTPPRPPPRSRCRSARIALADARWCSTSDDCRRASGSMT